MALPSTVSTRDNTADLGTKRLSKGRMRYLMNLCTVYDLSQSAMSDKMLSKGFTKVKQCQKVSSYSEALV